MPRPKKVPAVQITSDHEFDSSVLRFRRGVQGILDPGTHVHLAAIRLKPARLAELAVGRPRFTPLRWSSLSPAQVKALEDLVPNRGADDLVMYGDTCVVVCPEAEWQAEQRRKAQLSRQRMEEELSPRRVEREAGIPIDTRWEDFGEEQRPRSSG